MHVHILGICGTFMGSLALLARELGHTVTGSDANVYPPMSTQLERAGVTIQEGYLAEHLQPAPDLVIVGNAMTRGIEAVEYMLNTAIPYTSGPQFLSKHVLQYRHVLAVAGTHGKTTTTTMLAWILQYCGIDTGFLIGGVPLVDTDNERLTKAFAHSSYLGSNSLGSHSSNSDCFSSDVTDKDRLEEAKNTPKGYFVIEADEYDSAFFDKRSKFVHYRPTTAILNNLEFDHADIFANLSAIQTQFHHMIRMIPSNGQIIMPAQTPSLEATIDLGCWTPIWRTKIVESHSNLSSDKDNKSEWQASLTHEDGSQFTIQANNLDGRTNEDVVKSVSSGEVIWGLSGRHNVENALVAVAAAVNIGITVEQACQALSNFAGIKRRMERIADLAIVSKEDKLSAQGNGTINVLIYDDFAHHPTAIATTLDGATKNLKHQNIWAIIEPRSNTMKLGIHKDSLANSAALADTVLWYEPAGLEWGLKTVIETTQNTQNKQHVMHDTQDIIDYVVAQVQKSNSDTAIVIMSNGGFENIHQRLIQAFG